MDKLPIYEEEDTVFRDGRASEGISAEEETMGRRSPAAPVLSCYRGQEATVNATRPKTRSVGFLCTRNLGSAACDTDFQKILSKVWAGWWRDECRTFTVAEVVPSEALTAPPHSP